MLRIFAIALLAIVMSVGLAQARGHMHAQKTALLQCESERPAAATCLCGPGKMMCPKGVWCHAFISTCRP
jgi:hypothetical protein